MISKIVYIADPNASSPVFLPSLGMEVTVYHLTKLDDQQNLGDIQEVFQDMSETLRTVWNNKTPRFVMLVPPSPYRSDDPYGALLFELTQGSLPVVSLPTPDKWTSVTFDTRVSRSFAGIVCRHDPTQDQYGKWIMPTMPYYLMSVPEFSALTHRLTTLDWWTLPSLPSITLGRWPTTDINDAGMFSDRMEVWRFYKSWNPEGEVIMTGDSLVWDYNDEDADNAFL